MFIRDGFRCYILFYFYFADYIKKCAHNAMIHWLCIYNHRCLYIRIAFVLVSVFLIGDCVRLKLLYCIGSVFVESVGIGTLFERPNSYRGVLLPRVAFDSLAHGTANRNYIR